MFDPTNKQSLLSLTEALLKSRELLEPFRAVYKSAVEQMVGTYYSNSGADKPVPLNLIELAIRIRFFHATDHPISHIRAA